MILSGDNGFHVAIIEALSATFGGRERRAMSTYTLSPNDVAPLLEGLAILGTGGGGSPSWGKAILEHEFSVGRTPRIIPLQDIRDEATVVSGGMMGSVKVLEDMGIATVMQHWDNRFELLRVYWAGRLTTSCPSRWEASIRQSCSPWEPAWVSPS